jgi:predicted HAD superfamily Cof-like phosphohydrolase
MSIESIELWHRRGRPDPTPREFDIQLGCHLEEIVEMLAVINLTQNDTLVRARGALHWLADGLKQGRLSADITNRKEFLDAAADQIVTGVGVAHCAGMRIVEATEKVNLSNWSKYDVDGNPIFDENGKIKKGPGYAPPDLTGLY